MQKRHFNRQQYFKEQGYTTKKYVIPFIRKVIDIDKDSSILEIGCGEGGNLIPFVEMKCPKIVGVDLSKEKIQNATQFFNNEYGEEAKIKFIQDDFYNVKVDEIGQFDIIIMRDVIEHIHNQEKFMNFVKAFLSPKGRIFLGFPNWYMPFGGHQQICKNKFLSKVPYFHIFPKFIYRPILKIFGESDGNIATLLEIKDTGITIERFEKILKNQQYKIDKKEFFFINPNYEIKFGLKPRQAWSLISSIPRIRNLFITANYYLISKK